MGRIKNNRVEFKKAPVTCCVMTEVMGAFCLRGKLILFWSFDTEF